VAANPGIASQLQSDITGGGSLSRTVRRRNFLGKLVFYDETMKKLRTVVAVAVCILTSMLFGGCGSLSLPPAYRTEATVTPSDTAHQYVLQFVITELAKDGKTNVLNRPKVIVEAGQEAQIMVGEEHTVGDQRRQSGIFCTAIVRETAAGVEAVTTVTIKKNGIEKLSTSQSMAVKK
jgi:hypothetical protein